jgi:hypothetical protein
LKLAVTVPGPFIVTLVEPALVSPILIDVVLDCQDEKMALSGLEDIADMATIDPTL